MHNSNIPFSSRVPSPMEYLRALDQEREDSEKIRAFNSEWSDKRKDAVLNLMNMAKDEWGKLINSVNKDIQKGILDKEKALNSIQVFVAKYDNFREVRALIKAFDENIIIYERDKNPDFRQTAAAVRQVLEMFTNNLKSLMNGIIKSQEYLKSYGNTTTSIGRSI